MSGIRPTMISAPRVSIYLGNSPVAYAIGLSLNVGVSINPVYAIGSFEAISLEPVMYAPVSGVLQVIRLATPNNRQDLVANAAAANKGGVGDSGSAPYAPSVGLTADNDIVTLNSLYSHLDPALVLASETFDLHIFIKNVTDPTTNPPTTDLVSFMTIKDCRLTGRNTNISLGSLVNEPLTYMGLLAVNDTLASPEQLDYFADNK
jgi:hypothetical protein